MRLKHYDYASAGGYFITVCAWNRACVFGKICNDSMHANPLGKIVENTWQALPKHYPNVTLDSFVLMPNHVHGLLFITPWAKHASPRDTQDATVVGARHASPKDTQDAMVVGARHASPLLGHIIGSFKSAATRAINQYRGTAGAAVWQRNYYEHIVRNERDLEDIRHYIQQNPLRWALDKLNPVTHA